MIFFVRSRKGVKQYSATLNHQNIFDLSEARVFSNHEVSKVNHPVTHLQLISMVNFLNDSHQPANRFPTILHQEAETGCLDTACIKASISCESTSLKPVMDP